MRQQNQVAETGWPELRLAAIVLRDAENATMATLLGPLLISAFCLSQALRDIYFGHIFQDVDFFAVIFVAFSLSTLIFGAVIAIRRPGELRKLRSEVGTLAAVNVTTAVAWSCYFFALTYLEPAVVNTVHSGMAPLTVLALGAYGVRLAKPEVIRRSERLAYAGIALSLAALWGVALSGYSGLPDASPTTNVVGLALVSVSGGSITVSLLYCKRLQDSGISAGAVTVVRYMMLILLAASVEIYRGRMGGIANLDQLATLAFAATALIVLPLFVLQIGIGRTAPLTAHVIRALGPVCVFTLQQVDARLVYSTPTLLCIVAYSISAVAGNFAHGWRDGQPLSDRGVWPSVKLKSPDNGLTAVDRAN
jgi:drug/metabolite transporter (DMT)-like permease